MAADLDAAALTDGEMDHALMFAQHLSVEVHNLTRRGSFGSQPLDQPGIVAVGNEADVLAVGLVRHNQSCLLGELAGFALGQVAERKAEVVELVACGAI